MNAQILNGTAIAAQIRQELARETAALAAAGTIPRLAVVLAGNNPASAVYVRSKIKACEEVGMASELHTPAEDVSTEALLELVQDLNRRPEVDGILVQLPLPRQAATRRVLDAVDPAKDVDGLHPVNLGKLISGNHRLAPCTPLGIIQILKRGGIEIAGKEAVVVGRSDLVGKPLGLLLLHEHATVTICHSRTRQLEAVCQRADILVAAIGQAAVIGERHIKPGAVVIDVGTNRLTSAAEVEKYFPGDAQRLEQLEKRGATPIGDVDPWAVRERASAFTPVPGGVGPLTVTMLLANTLTAARLRRGDGMTE